MGWPQHRSWKGGEQGLHLRDTQKARGPLFCSGGRFMILEFGGAQRKAENRPESGPGPNGRWHHGPMPEAVAQAPLSPDRCEHGAGTVAEQSPARGFYLWQVCFGLPGAPHFLQGEQDGSQLPLDA